MKTREIKLSKAQFKIFNGDDQFQLFCDDEGFPAFEDFDEEVDKLYAKYDYISVDDNYCIYGVKKGIKEELSDQAGEGYAIAKEVTEDYPDL